MELLADRSPDAWLQKMLQVNPTYGKGYALIASHLVINRRYDEGVAYYRKAIDLDPRLWSARSQLGINLMRLGQEDEPRQQLELCYNNGYRDAATVNSLRLLDSYKNFTVVHGRADDPQARHEGSRDLLQPYFDEVLTRAIDHLRAEVQDDAAGPGAGRGLSRITRTSPSAPTGMPGLGALGVTFGTVVAMDSPSGRKPGSFNWAGTLWHEMNHVFVLTATNHRVPRWFTEGLAVHEEGQANPAWADRLTPDVVVALKDKKLLPVAQLDRGLRPSRVSRAGPGLLLSGGPDLRLHPGALGRRQAGRHGARVRRAEADAGGHSAGARPRAGRRSTNSSRPGSTSDVGPIVDQVRRVADAH